MREAKIALRRRILELRDGIDPVAHRTWSERILERLMALEEMASARTVHVFASFGSEVDTIRLIGELLDTGRRAVLPVVDRARWTMTHRSIGRLGDLEPGFKGIREPCPGCEAVEPSEIDLVIVPGVAFDRTGGRLGYGGGFYDSFLALCRGTRVALAFSLQVVDEVPCEARDLPVHAVVTEEEVIRSSP
jgi:5-formyltetrahydrofolate cyclo-ligase